MFTEGRSAVFLGLLWCVWLGALAMGERVPVNDGRGGDGSRFAKMTQAGPAMLFDKEINSYYVSRVGPSFAVRLFLGLVGAPLDDAAVRNGFIVLNTLLLSAALLFVMAAGTRLGLGSAGRWVLFLGLFANQPNGRLPIYYAPIGDSTAFFLGSTIAWAYVARRPKTVFATFLLALVSWPATLLLLPLLIWPRAPLAEPEEGAAAAPRATIASFLAAIPAGVALFGALWLAVDMPGFDALTPQMVLSLSANAFYVGLAAVLAGAVAWSERRGLLAWPSPAGLTMALVLLALGAAYVRAFESGSLAFSGQTYGREIILFARTRPLAAVPGHAAYYGGLAIMTMALWSLVLREGLRLGAGAFITVAVAGLFSLDAESRRLNASWPIVGLLAALVVARLCADRKSLLIFAAATLVVSKLWWPLGGPLLLPAAHDPGNYYNLQGSSMSVEAAIAHGIAIIVIGGWSLALRRRTASLA